MQIFDQEIKDGLEKSILESSCISYASEINIPKEVDVAKLLLHSANAGKEDIDLFYIDSILVSVGWNKNDDIFDANEVWKARYTPINKQFNLLHNDNYIVGHIISSVVVEDDKVVADDIETPPESFDVLVGSVIYRKWQDQIKQEYIDKVIAEIKEGKWFVSMECLFPTFDYGLISSSGEKKIIKRDKESAFLTKHLARYGGKGTYKDYKIGRVLRDIVFSGKGLVKNPANSRSVIFTDKVSFAGQDISIEVLKSEKDKMADMEKSIAEVTVSYEKQIAELKSQLDAVKAENLNKEKQSLAEADQKSKAKIDELNKSISDLQAEVKSLKDSIAAKDAEAEKMKKEKEDKEKEAKTYADEVSKLKSEITSAKRVSKLVSAGVNETDAVAFVTEWSTASDEQFTKLSDLYVASKAKKEDKVDKTTASVNDVVEEEAGKITPGNIDTNEELQSAVASWFKSAVSEEKDNQ